MNCLTYDNNEHRLVGNKKNVQSIKKVAKRNTMLKVITLT